MALGEIKQTIAYPNSEIRLVGGFLDLVKAVQILPQEPLKALEGVFEPL